MQLPLLSMNWKRRLLIWENSGFFFKDEQRLIHLNIYNFLLILISILDHFRSTVSYCNFNNTYFIFSDFARKTIVDSILSNVIYWYFIVNDLFVLRKIVLFVNRLTSNLFSFSFFFLICRMYCLAFVYIHDNTFIITTV